jgi:hypothetical protein
LEKIHKPFVKKEGYYQGYPLKPGFEFYRALIHAKTPIEVLDVNIPVTIINTDSQYLLFKDEDTGRLTKKIDASFQEFEQRLVKGLRGFQLKEDESAPNGLSGKDLPFAIQRMPMNDNGLCNKRVLNYREIESRRMYMIEPFTYYQKFIMPKGYRASILRLVYYTSNSTEAKVYSVLGYGMNIG